MYTPQAQGCDWRLPVTRSCCCQDLHCPRPRPLELTLSALQQEHGCPQHTMTLTMDISHKVTAVLLHSLQSIEDLRCTASREVTDHSSLWIFSMLAFPET